MPQAQKPRLNRPTSRVTKFERISAHKAKITHFQAGKGCFLYQNNTKGTLTLPKPTATGQVTVPLNGRWEGDDYYMSLVRTGMARMITEIVVPKEEEKLKMLNEQKLILDQPDRVTTKGTVEHVLVDTQPKKKLVEHPVEPVDVLLLEDPLAGVQILG